MKGGPLTEGLDALDRARAASLADEGGSAGAAVGVQSEEVAMKGTMPAPRRDSKGSPAAPPVGRPAPFDAQAPLFDEQETPARPLPAIQSPDDDDAQRDQRSTR